MSGIRIDAGGIAKVAWGSAFQDTPLAVGAPFSLPAGVAVPNTFIVTAEVHYAYTPVIGYTLTGTFDLKDQFYLRPRLSTGSRLQLANHPPGGASSSSTTA